MTTRPHGARRRLRWPRQSPTDWMLGGIGFSMATASASFAGYMIVTAPAEVTGFGSRDFNVFVQWDRRSTQKPGHGPADHPGPAAPATAQAAVTAGVDMTPTGSIPGGDPDSPAARTPVGAGAGAPLREFRVRDVFGGHALIEHRSRLTLVQQGSILAGAGEVLAIERQGGLWIVRTASGIIGGS